MKSVVELWVTCLQEAGDLHCVRIQRDEAYALSRIEDEGMAFLAITLPNFEKDLLTGISRGFIDSDLFPSFRKRGGLPAFLSGFLCRLFDSAGFLRDDASPAVLRTIRQVLLLVSKMDADTSEKRKRAAIEAFVTTDQTLEEVNLDALADFKMASKALLSPFLADIETRLYNGDWQPRHSSGSNADRSRYNERFSNRTWTERLDRVFPWWEDLAVSPREIVDLAGVVSILAPGHEPPVKVTLVPKTMKAPRVIAMEPNWMQFVQQGIFAVMSETLQLPRYRALARVFSWLDQVPNRVLARTGSIDGSFATIDLSEASDRVSLQLVETLLSNTPFLRECVLACRSPEALLPDGRTVRLKKFASMGSALCFPIESMVFFIIEALAFADSEAMVPAALRIRGLPQMRVFGDDLIVPSSVARSLMERLETYGLKVNTRKSFTTGHFRESCGSDWFRGEDVSVFKLRAPLPSSRRQIGAIDRAVSFHNMAYSHGWYRVAGVTETSLKRLFPDIPYCAPGTLISALWSWDRPYVVRTDPKLHRTAARSVVFRQVKPSDSLSEYGALKKYYAPHLFPRDVRHLQRDGRSRYVSAHIGWLPVPYQG